MKLHTKRKKKTENVCRKTEMCERGAVVVSLCVVVDRREMSNKSFCAIQLLLFFCIVYLFLLLRFGTVKRSPHVKQTLDWDWGRDESEKSKSQRLYRFLCWAWCLFLFFLASPCQAAEGMITHFGYITVSRKQRHSSVFCRSVRCALCQVSARHTSTTFKLCQPKLRRTNF